MRDAYFAADFLVHPTFYDPCSLVVLEALACGLPMITTRANGASELMTPPREGYVIDDPHDHQCLAACLQEMLDKERRHGCSAAARAAAKVGPSSIIIKNCSKFSRKRTSVSRRREVDLWRCNGRSIF